MNRRPIELLIEAARKAQGAERASVPETAPLGFASRVASRARGMQRGGLDLFERLTWWASGVGAVVCLSAFIYRQSLPEPNAFDLFIEGEAEVANPR